MLSDVTWGILIKFLHDRNMPFACGTDLAHTETFCKTHGLSFPKLKKLLNKNGAYCDCEVLWNLDVKQKFPIDSLINLDEVS